MGVTTTLLDNFKALFPQKENEAAWLWTSPDLNPTEHQQKQSLYRRFKEYSTLADHDSIVAGGMGLYISMTGGQTMP
jgi:hypothetical protein